MRLQTERTRLFISTWYTGSGSKKSVFTRRPNSPFERIRKIYGEELERMNIRQSERRITFHTLTVPQKNEIRQRAIREIKIENTKKIISLILAVGLTISLIFIAHGFIKLKINQ